MAHSNLKDAKKIKNDEFYTQYEDIQREVNAYVYTQQTTQAKQHNLSNCPLCALGADNNKNRIWKITEMDADHVTAWSKGGATDIGNCQMLCKTHNRAKGNK